MNYEIDPATSDDTEAILALLPRLAEFNVPADRNPEDLWRGDAEMVSDWAAGNRPDVEALVARTNKELIGVAIISFRKELLSSEPSAHLEVLALQKSAEGHGIAQALVQGAERLAVDNGAKSMSLHVFANNLKARALYERLDFEGELIRYFKLLDN